MKYNVYIKVLAAFFLVTFVFIIAFFKYMRSVEVEIAVNSQKTITFGILNDLESELISTPKSQWNSIIKTKKYENIYIVSIHKLGLTSSQSKKLGNGEVVFKIGKELQFLNLVIARKVAYKKIKNSSLVIAYDFSVPEFIISYYMAPSLEKIVATFLSKLRDTWAKEAITLGKIYGYPIHVYNKDSKDLPIHVLNTLQKEPLAFTTKANTSQIDLIYYPFSAGVLRVGPLKYLSVTDRISDVIYYFVLSFFILIFLIISVVSLLFVRNMKKIYLITTNFSHSNFSFREKIGTTSVLYGLYANIIAMGERLQQLIKSHKQMCRFVAHETRTPLSTMQMTIDNIKRTETLDGNLDKKINSVEEDINAINDLVSTFLLYSQLQSQDFVPNTVKLNIVSWLKNIVNKYHFSKFTVSFDDGNTEEIQIHIDDKLFSYAINNLITNATKFAKNNIHLSIESINGSIVFHVDDDGPGISDDIKEDIFSEYFCTIDDDSYDKHIGLGLAIVKKVVVLHSGRVAVAKSPTLHGARFTIILPK